jgi:U3 small nucleolar ribonucleoprotein protein LCP5
VQQYSDQITGKLIEHRVYLERGVRPLEGKIKYQTDRLVKVAEDEERARVKREEKAALGVNSRKHDENESGEESDIGSEDDDEEEDEDVKGEETSSGPRIASMIRSSNSTQSSSHPANSKTGAYRPPRISATSMPTTEGRKEKDRRPARSATVDEYIATELSTAPVSLPSIGSTIAERGRSTKNPRQLAKEQERREYEETHLMRLPKESKKEIAKQRARERRGYGGEELQGLGEAVDRIGDLTRRKKGKEGVLEKSRKRRATEDGPRGDGGGAFDAKRKKIMKRMKR